MNARDTDFLDVTDWHAEPEDPRAGPRAFFWVLLAAVLVLLAVVAHPWTAR